MKRLFVFALMALLVTITGMTAYAQDSGSISGTVTDVGTGDPIEGAGVSLRMEGNWNFHRMMHTDADGNYSFGELPAGSFLLQAGALGYILQEYPEPVAVDGDDV